MITKQAQNGSMWGVAALCLMATAFLATPSSAETRLWNGIPITGLSAQKGDMLQFFLPTFEDDWIEEGGHFVISLSGGKGDADLYVMEGDTPTPTSYDYYSDNRGNEEVCTLPPSVSAWVHVTVYAYKAFSGVTLVGRYELGTELETGVPVTGLSAAAGEETRLFFQTPDDARSLVVTVSGLDGDGWFSLSRGEPRRAVSGSEDWFELAQYDCVMSWDDSCVFEGQVPNMWYAVLSTDEGLSDVTVTANASRTLCAPGPTWLCLNEGRFRVEVTWRNESRESGLGQVVPNFSADSGLFWFFSPDNWEMLVKVVKGCRTNGHYWVFSAATTNVEYDLRVRDTETGEERIYSNPSGRAAPAITDIGAFATCP